MHEWFDGSNNQISTAPELDVTLQIEDQNFTLRHTNNCNFQWFEIFQFSSHLNESNNLNYVEICEGQNKLVHFNSDYSYNLTGYEEMINNYAYSFSPNSDTVIYYTLQNQNDCLFNDSLQINTIESTPVFLTLIPPFTIQATSGFESYQWFSQSQFTQSNASQNEIIAENNAWYFVQVTDANGCTQSNSIYVIVDSVLITPELSFDEISVLNPILANELEIISKGNQSIYITIQDLNGKEIFKSEDFAGYLKEEVYFSSGIYLLNIYSKNTNEIVKKLKVVKL
jgi:hypothetical protein